MTKKLKIMVVPFEAGGHLSATLGIAHVLRSRGHQVIYAIHKSQEGSLIKSGFDVEIIDNILKDGNGLHEWASRLVADLDVSENDTNFDIIFTYKRIHFPPIGISFVLPYNQKN